MRVIGSQKIKDAYAFLVRQEKDDSSFTFQELLTGSGWSSQTARANLTKKLKRFVIRDGEYFRVHGVLGYTEEAFCKVCSQSSDLSGDPLKPILEPDTEALVSKSRDAALGALQQYNNPVAVFRSGNFIVLMIIGFTALFHAVFERDSIDYIARNKEGLPKFVGTDQMLWDISQSSSEYVTNYHDKYPVDFLRAMTTNLEFFLPIRHKIEHRHMPQLDPEIAGHCQAMLYNFERILTTEFTSYYSLSSSLTLALQLSAGRSPSAVTAERSFHAAEYAKLKKYIHDFHAGISDEIMGDPAFALRMWLVPKSAKNARASDVTLDYVHIDKTDAAQMAALEQRIVAINRVVRETQNIAFLLPKDVSRIVEATIGRRFAHSSHHVRAVLHHKVRPPKGSRDPAATQPMYCVYNLAFRQYVYTQEWVDFLIREYSNEHNYAKIFGPASNVLKSKST